MSTRALVVVGGDDTHHDLLGAADVLTRIGSAAGFVTSPAVGMQRFVNPRPETADADVYVLYDSGAAFGGDQQAALAAAVSAGKGVVALHMSNVMGDPEGADRAYRDLLGNHYLSHGPGHHEGRHRIDMVAAHPVTDGVDDFELFDEYYEFAFADDNHTVLAERTREDGVRIPVLYAREVGEGRVVYFALGHDMRAWGEPSFRRILAQAIRWAGRA
ncbi:ThuA domain-containing protein [Microbacterium aurugineum]|uniref:ThuA domain-containing protein n=1 Tax=Microbacterium aurugineum TaxID=2851642 RepID=UPI0020BFBAFC|nr:ThuA domain-containing protein [Microbacterium aurugineum]MCK8475553.1 ThuA domain-containing protein [Microbacterium aurugineum]